MEIVLLGRNVFGGSMWLTGLAHDCDVLFDGGDELRNPNTFRHRSELESATRQAAVSLGRNIERQK